MPKTTNLQCACEATRLEVIGKPIASLECCCKSCREGATRMGALKGAPDVLTSYGASPYVMVRKDRVHFTEGFENLCEFRLKPHSKTRRVFAGCCNTPIFTEFEGGHWVSIFAQLWPDSRRPRIEMRTMVSDLPTGVILPDDVSNAQKYNLRILPKLLGAWAGMRFKIPKMAATHKVDL